MFKIDLHNEPKQVIIKDLLISNLQVRATEQTVSSPAAKCRCFSITSYSQTIAAAGHAPCPACDIATYQMLYRKDNHFLSWC